MKAEAENGEEKKTALIAANEFIAPQWMDFMHAHYCVWTISSMRSITLTPMDIRSRPL